jgi:hypothetical protein
MASFPQQPNVLSLELEASRYPQKLHLGLHVKFIFVQFIQNLILYKLLAKAGATGAGIAQSV